MPDLLAKNLPNCSLSQLVNSDQIFTLPMTIELLMALLQSQLNLSEVHGQITPDRIIISLEQPLRVQILPADHLGVDPEFSAPEVLTDNINCNSDLYSIGLIIIYVLTGIRPFNSQQAKVNCLAISPDGRLMISGGSDKTIKLWLLGLSDNQSIDRLSRYAQGSPTSSKWGCL